MNRIFKVVWNEIRGSYMVCDENRVARGKTKSVKAAVVVASVAAMMGLSGMAMAQEQTVTEKMVENETFENIKRNLQFFITGDSIRHEYGRFRLDSQWLHVSKQQNDAGQYQRLSGGCGRGGVRYRCNGQRLDLYKQCRVGGSERQ